MNENKTFGSSATRGLCMQAVTPLYGFACNETPLAIGSDITVHTMTDELMQPFEPDDIFVQQVRMHRPQHLLWQSIWLSKAQVDAITQFTRDVNADEWKGDATQAEPLFSALVAPVSRVLRAFQLFKPGRFVAGDTSFFVHLGPGRGVTLNLARCSEMLVDFQYVTRGQTSYGFGNSEVPFFLAFIERLDQVWPSALRYSQIELAAYKYASESAAYGDPVDLMGCLEALLVPEEEGISYKLALRVANLVGPDAESRKEIFTKMRKFYGLRSKAVHGAELKKRDL